MAGGRGVIIRQKSTPLQAPMPARQQRRAPPTWLQLLSTGRVLSTLVFNGVGKMRKFVVAIVVAAPLALLSGVGSAKGCLKGAAVGGVVGHVAGRHAVVGAAAGCVIEHHREKVRDKAEARQDKASQNKASQNKADGDTARTAPSQ